jgi:hypothetical protein
MSDESPSPGRADARLLLEIATAIAGSGALISALMLYFGWVRTRVLFDHFGVPVSILNYGTNDYVLRSAEVIFKPAVCTIIVAAVLAAVSAGMHRAESSNWNRSTRLFVRLAMAATTSVGVAIGLLGIAGGVNASVSSVLLCSSGALVIVQYQVRRAHASSKPPVAMLVLGLLLTLVGAFWAVSVYAAAIGIAMADDIAAGRALRPDVVVYSTTDLGISGRQGDPCRLLADGTTCRFTYVGFRLLAYTNNRWFLIRYPWSPGMGTVILPDDRTVRVELRAA